MPALAAFPEHMRRWFTPASWAGWETDLNLATGEIHFVNLGATLCLAEIYDDLTQYLDTPAS